ncbi:hypothetical protein MMC30_008976 [Trapelia coarctata]|nr:hypothetical protein [Trapelia coarctata]
MPDYRIFESPADHPVYKHALEEGFRTLVTKEELGHERHKGECNFQLIPDMAYSVVKPLFLFRDPIRVFDSWKNVGWQEIESLVMSYKTLHAHLSDKCISIIYEELIREPRYTLEAICAFWEIGFNNNMLHFKHHFGDFLYGSERERKIYTVDNPLGLFDTVKAFHTLKPLKSHGLVSKQEIDYLEKELCPLYLELHGSRLQQLRSTLRDKTWFGFDLDDTLHEFRKASGAASKAVFREISGSEDVSEPDLEVTYRAILAQKAAGAFTDGKTSTEYRRERFAALMDVHKISYIDAELARLAEVYQTVLKSAIELKSGALELICHLKSIGKQIAVITEGPEDAQVWTIEELGLSQAVDALLTTNKMGKSKVDGMFVAALQHLCIGAEEMVYVGDNEKRDVEPASREGIFSIHYSEESNVQLTTSATCRINSLWKLKYLLS